MRIPEIRLQNQQLSTPLFGHPKELVSWMGAMQAQDYTMVKWAVGMRLKSPGIQAVEKALHQGEILRTHIMRPTWHLVAAEDIRWMLKLSAQRIKSANDSYAKGHGLEITEQQYDRSHTVLGNILSGKRSLTKQEIAEHFERSGLLADNYHMTRFMSRADIIKEYRLSTAERLLVSSNFTIEELMDRTGFTNRSTFYKAFSQRYGMPPRQYCERQKKNVREGQEITNT